MDTVPPDAASAAAASASAAAAAAGSKHFSIADANDLYVHGSGRDSIVMCEGGDDADELFDSAVGCGVLDITADDGKIRNVGDA